MEKVGLGFARGGHQGALVARGDTYARLRIHVLHLGCPFCALANLWCRPTVTVCEMMLFHNSMVSFDACSLLQEL